MNLRTSHSSELDANNVARFQSVLLEWFVTNGREFAWRREDAPHYNQILAELMLQRTRAATVQYHIEWILEAYPTWEAILCAGPEKLGRDFRPLGLWKRRATSLTALATEMLARGGSFPDKRDELLALPAIGQYMANAILLITKGLPLPLLDVNMARVLERYFGFERTRVDIRSDSILQRNANHALDTLNPKKLNWAILDLGALVCKQGNPVCDSCPLATHCATRGSF
ncbi:MAG: hypothetical protein JAZ17_16420 [Candidatus Thiodiazotropha endolucinida]|nr:hypothetical protein [Candidatus Thiodiazotropha endolucinida]